MANLIVHNKAEWNIGLVRSVFLPHEAEAILCIPISPINQAEAQVWAKTPNGIFSVKSAYKVAVKYLADSKGDEGRPGCSDNSRMEAIWMLI